MALLARRCASVLLMGGPSVTLRRALAVGARVLPGLSLLLLSWLKTRRLARFPAQLALCRSAAWLRRGTAIKRRRCVVAKALTQLFLIARLALGTLVLRLRQGRARSRRAACTAHRAARCVVPVLVGASGCRGRFIELESDHGNQIGRAHV